MRRTFRCPDCDEPLRYPEDEARTVRCRHCDARVPVPRRDDRAAGFQERSRPRRPPSSEELPAPRAGVPAWAIVTGAITAGLLLGGLLIAGLFVATRSTPPVAVVNPPPVQNPPAVQNPPPAPVPGPNPPAPPANGIHADFERPDPPSAVPFAVDPKLTEANGPVFLNDLQEFAPGKWPPRWTFGKNGITGNGWEPGQTITVRGVHYRKGLSMHPPHEGYARICYALGERSQTLRGHVGMRDARTPPTRFVVLGDGQVLWRSDTITTDDRVAFAVDVSRVKVLELRTYVEQGTVFACNAFWLDPVVDLKPR